MKKSFLLAAIFIFGSPSVTYAQSVYPREYQSQVMTEINTILAQQNIRQLELDPNLCEVADKVAQESENIYPQKLQSK